MKRTTGFILEAAIILCSGLQTGRAAMDDMPSRETLFDTPHVAVVDVAHNIQTALAFRYALETPVPQITFSFLDESDPNLLKPLYYVWVAITRTEQGAEYGLAVVNASTDIYFVEHFIAQHTIREQLQTTGFITGVPVEIAEQIKRKFAK